MAQVERLALAFYESFSSTHESELAYGRGVCDSVRNLPSESGPFLTPTDLPAHQLLLSGFIATTTLYLFYSFLPLYGYGKVDAVEIMSTLRSDDFAFLAPLQFITFGAVVFPVLFARLFYSDMAGRTLIQKSISWSIILWLVRELVVLPMIGEGLFSLTYSYTIDRLVLVFIGHFVYGISLGTVQTALLLHNKRTSQNRRQ